jgi:hypothetical protein
MKDKGEEGSSLLLSLGKKKEIIAVLLHWAIH